MIILQTLKQIWLDSYYEEAKFSENKLKGIILSKTLKDGTIVKTNAYDIFWIGLNQYDADIIYNEIVKRRLGKHTLRFFEKMFGWCNMPIEPKYYYY